MDAVQLKLIKRVTSRLKDEGYRHLAEVEEDGSITIHIFKGRDES